VNEVVDNRGPDPEEPKKPRGRPARLPDRLERHTIWAASLAALGESGVLWLPIRLTAVQLLGVSRGPLATYPMFVVLFVGTTAVATRFRRFAAMPTVAAVAGFGVGLAQGLIGSPRSGATALIGAILGMLVALRVVTLGLRDWRNPVEASFGWGAAFLLAEIFMASSAHAGWEPVMPVIVALFFGASLASRAVSVSLAAAESGATIVGGEGVAAGGPRRLSWSLLAGLAIAVAVGALLGVPGGPFELVGRVVLPILGAVIVGVSLVLGLIGQGIATMLGWLHLDFARGLQRVMANLSRIGKHGVVHTQPTGGGWLNRVVGVVILAVIAWFVFRLVRRRRAVPASQTLRARASAQFRARPRSGKRRPPPRARRRELPAETVRRWYAEALLLLEGRGLPKPGWETPADYADAVTAAYPGSRIGFETLTRAYEEVRYGARDFDRSRLDGIRTEWEPAMMNIQLTERADAETVAASDEPQGEDAP
jgi:Domain of unknown function (DUF4129)